LLEASFRAGVAAADPLEILPPHLPGPPRGRTLVLAAGKAAASMALAVERHWPDGAALEGIALTRYGHGLPTERIRVVEAGHPVPDEAGERAAREMLQAARGLDPQDLLLALVSGGGSALLSLPGEGVTMAGLRAVTRELLRCGATIQEINTVRKHLSAIQGGRLAAASRAPVLALIISDVTGDDPTHIASGPCAPDPTTCGDAAVVLAKYGMPAAGAFSETPKPGDPLFERVENRVIATARRSLDAAAAFFRAQGVAAEILGDAIIGEAAEVGRSMAAQAREPGRQLPVALISGGECTVTVGAGGGRGGRCSEFLLALAIALEGRGAHAIAADTDGIDGSEDNAGAVLAPDSLERARVRGLDPGQLLSMHDSYGFFAALGDLVVTGPTRTNVNDYRAILLTA
jgi:hydroxypyruvate reductase